MEKQWDDSGLKVDKYRSNESPKTAIMTPAAAMMKTSLLLASLASANYLRVPLEDNWLNALAKVSFGSPPVEEKLNVDTGSSDTWIGVNLGNYNPEESATYVNKSTPAQVGYMDDTDWNGHMGLERITIGGGVVNDANIGFMMDPVPPYWQEDGEDDNVPYSGYLGLSFEGLAMAPVYSNPLPKMKEQGVVKRRSFGVYLDGKQGGELTFGGYDQDRIHKKLSYLPLVNSKFHRFDKPTPYEYTVMISSMMRGKKDLLKRPGTRPKCVETYLALFDTGYTMSSYPQHVYDALFEDFEAVAQPDGDNVVPCVSDATKRTYKYGFDDITIAVPGSSFIMKDPDTGKCRLLASPHNKPNRMVLGLPFFRAAYVYFDPEGFRIGLAQQNKKATGVADIVVQNKHVGKACWINAYSPKDCS